MLKAFRSVCGYYRRGLILLAVALSCFACPANGQTSAALTPIYAFTGGADGDGPQADLIQGKDGNFYGSTISGGGDGSSSVGTIFKITSAGVLTTLYTFTGGVYGGFPAAALTQGSDGNFYGTTEYEVDGGSDGNGTVFKLTPAGVLTTLYTFPGGANGSYPEASLTLGNDGNFYGTASGGDNSNNDGAVFKITPAGALTTLHTFTGGADGRAPKGALTLGKDGNFYSTTLGGGNYDCGTVFEITPAGVLTTLYNFTNGADGATPSAGLTLGSDGYFYGTTYYGGSSGNNGAGYGTVFKISATGALTTLFTFSGGAGGAFPEADLKQGSDGNFYGTTEGNNGSGDGTVFKITPAGVLTTLHAFTGGVDGENPVAGLILGSDGNFYSTASQGGQYGYGVVFRLTLTPAVTGETERAQVGAAFSYQIISTNSPTSFAASNLPPGLSINTATGLISGAPSQSGSFSVGLTATNSFGAGTATLTINVVPPAPAITSGPPPNGQVGVPYSFQVAATNSPSSFSPAGLPPGLSLNATTGLIDGTPTQAGTFNAAITATNAGGSSIGMYSVTILPAVPVITSAASASGQEGQPFTYQIAASNSPTSYNATGLPGGLNVDVTSGLISGTPTTTGATSVMLTATNAGGTGSAMLTLNLSLRPSQTPTITSSAGASATVGAPFSFAVTATNSPSSFGAVGLPPGLSIDPSNGLISGTPTQSGAYTVGISATNASGAGTGDFTVTVTIPSADVTGIHIISPPSDINIVQGETITVDATVDALPGALQTVDYDVYDATNTNLVTPLSADAAAGNEFNWIPTALGDYTLRVTAIDTAGNTFPDSIPIHVITSPNAAPNSTLLSGLDGKTFAAGSTLPLVGLATDASGAPISNAAFYVNGVAVPAGASSAGAAGPSQLQPKDAATSAFTQASYQVTALEDALLTLIGTDSNGVTSVSAAAKIHFTAAASGAAPTCAITSPAAATQVVPGASVQATATATESSGSIAQVEFFVNNTSAGKVTSAPYTLNIPTSAVGQFALTAIATDSQGISQASAPVIVSVAPQVVTIAVKGDGQAVVGGKKGKATVTRTGDTSAPLKVRFKIAGAVEAGVDYEALSSLKVTIPAGESQAEIKLTALGNPSVEGARVAKIKLLPSTDGAYSLGAEVKANIKLTDN